MTAHGLRALAGCRLAAVDLGPRYTGLALRTARLEGARPYGVIERVTRERRSAGRSEEPWRWVLRTEHATSSRQFHFASQGDALQHVLCEQNVAAVVVGMPYLADGSYSKQCAAVERRVHQLQAEWTRQVPILLWDESYSTKIALASHRAGRDRAHSVHARAACVVLEEVLEALFPLEVSASQDPMAPQRIT